MRRYLSIILVCLPVFCLAQSIQPQGAPTTTVWNKGAYITDTTLVIPFRDTTFPGWFTTQRKTGALLVRPGSVSLHYYNGTSWPRVLSNSDISATTGQVIFQGPSSLLGNNNFFWNNTDFRLGIRTNTPDSALTVSGPANITTNTRIGGILNVDSIYSPTLLSFGTNGTERLNISSSGQLAGVYNAMTYKTVPPAGGSTSYGFSVNNTSGKAVALTARDSGTSLIYDQTGAMLFGYGTKNDIDVSSVSTPNIQMTLLPTRQVLMGASPVATNGTDRLQVQGALRVISGVTGLGLFTADPTSAAGDIWYRTDLNRLRANINGTPTSVLTTSDAWGTSGNGATTFGTNFIGTTNNVGLAVKVNNIFSGRIEFATLTGNTSWGFNTILAPTTGNSNNAFGSNALAAITTGTGNVAIGNQTLAAMLGGSSNTVVGVQSARAQTSGSSNTIVGFNSYLVATTGSSNTTLGDQTLLAYTGGGGGQNTVLGSGAGITITSGQMNSMLGRSSGALLATGDNNTFLGAASGLNQTSGNLNISIGYNSEVPTKTGSNQLSIGNLIFGTGLTGSVASPAGNIGIGDVAPSTRLSVTGTAKSTNFYTTSAVPTVVLGNGAGTSPSFSAAGTNQGLRISVTVGAAATTNDTVFRFTYSGGFVAPNGTVCGRNEVNQAALDLNGLQNVRIVGTATGGYMLSGSVGLSAGTYIFDIPLHQY